nr:hypothetical protein [Candidatus Sigynarchaeum springense]MDO8117938.1 2-oxoisovalerate dehydrogenase [Candidatus Sigynarchaeota archaeon]
MKETIFIVEESLDGLHEARALETSIFTEADTLQELKKSIKDAARYHFDEYNAPRIMRLHFIKDGVILDWNSHVI